MTGLIVVAAAPWLAIAGLVGAGARKLARDRRGEAPIPGGYEGRHRARLLSTMEMNRARAAVRARAIAAARMVRGELALSRGLRLPAPRSPWGTPEWVDEWTGGHDPVPSGAGR